MVKAAIEGLTLSLRREVTPFGITAMTVEAGGFRTDLAGRSLVQPETPIADYVETAGKRRKEHRAGSRHAARIPGAGSGRVDRRTAGGSRRLGGRQPQHRLHRLTTSQGRRMVQPWWPDCVVQARSTGFVGDRMHI